jgi:hypothetical protein
VGSFPTEATGGFPPRLGFEEPRTLKQSAIQQYAGVVVGMEYNTGTESKLR